MRRATRSLTLTTAVVLLAGCAPTGGGASGEASPDDGGEAIVVGMAETDAGPSLVGPDGLTLYIFTQDTEGTSTCADECAAAWPPFEVEAGATVEAGEGVSGDLAIIQRDDGTSQVTHEGRPLYFYAEDAGPGDASGEGVGGVWFIASPSGQSGVDASESADPSESAEPSESDDDGDPYDYGT